MVVGGVNASGGHPTNLINYPDITVGVLLSLSFLEHFFEGVSCSLVIFGLDLCLSQRFLKLGNLFGSTLGFLRALSFFLLFLDLLKVFLCHRKMVSLSAHVHAGHTSIRSHHHVAKRFSYERHSIPDLGLHFLDVDLANLWV